MSSSASLSLTLAMLLGGADDQILLRQDRPDLRATMKQSHQQIDFSVSFDFKGRYSLPFDGSLEFRVQKAEKELRGDGSDCTRLCFLARFRDDQEKREEAGKTALAIAERQAQRSPEDLAVQLHLASALAAAGKQDEAETLLRRLTKQHARNADVWIALGRQLHDKALISAIANSDPQKRIAAVLPIGTRDVSLRSSQYEEAMQCFDRAVEIAPTASKTYFARWEGRSLRTVSNKVHTLAQTRDTFHLVLFECFHPDAMSDLRRATELAPEDVRLIYALIKRRLQLGWAAFWRQFKA